MAHEEKNDPEAALKQLLERRAAPPEAPWLAASIIEATAQPVPEKRSGAGSGIAELLPEILPRPAYAFASALLLGFLCGYVMPLQAPGSAPSSLQSVQSMVQDFLAVDERML